VRAVGFLSRDVVQALRRVSPIAICLMGGYSLIEAAAAGAAVIAYDVEWHRELVVDGETGRLLPEHDTHAVAAALDDLLGDPVLTRRLGAQARTLAVAKHSLAYAQSVRRQVYADLLDSSERTTG
jgi:glycosyltransferase involved in cell wall biosynthesis